MNFLFRYANPHEFMRLSGKLLPFTAIATAACLAAALYLGFSAPPDYQQGRTVLILFIHVPAATLALSVYGAIAVCSLLSLVFLAPLLLMMAGYALLFVTLWMIRIRTAILERRARTLMQAN